MKGTPDDTLPVNDSPALPHTTIYCHLDRTMAEVAITILQVVAEIYEIAEGIKENNRQARRLLERVEAIEPAVLTVKRGRRRLSSESLRQLLETFEAIRNFLDGFARTTKISRAWARKSNAAKFTDFGAALSEGVQALQLDVAVDSWAKEDASDRVEDLENLIGMMESMEHKRTDNHAEIMRALKVIMEDEPTCGVARRSPKASCDLRIIHCSVNPCVCCSGWSSTT